MTWNCCKLLQEQNSNYSGPLYTNTYVYDGAQNRTSLNGSAIGHTPDNQFSDTTHYGYDGNGNPTGYTSPGNPVLGRWSKSPEPPPSLPLAARGGDELPSPE